MVKSLTKNSKMTDALNCMSYGMSYRTLIESQNENPFRAVEGQIFLFKYFSPRNE